LKFSDLFRKKSVESILAETNNNITGNVKLLKELKLRDLTSFGIAAIIGAGIFSTIGNAAVNGGPAVSILFIITAIACGFSAMCYARFASVIPISGSAYTYAYTSFGELVAWIIGWDLIMEYAVGNIAVAISWSDYFTSMINGLGIHFPKYFAIDYFSASRGFEATNRLLSNGIPFSHITHSLQEAWTAWQFAPKIGGLRIIVDIPAIGIVVIITWLVFMGIQETKKTSNILVLLKVIILLLVIAVGAFYVNPGNWNPFAPNGLGGILKGVSGVFFAYIGFDAISTTAEECKNPQKDLPRAMMLSLLITTVLYVIISLVLTGMVNYRELGVGDPLSYVFQKLHLRWLSGIVALSAVIAMAGVLLVFQVGQPRIWMSMSRDGLLPKRFSKLHEKFRTPAFSTIITGIIVALPIFFVNLVEVTDLTSIGTLFAFVLVSGGILIMDSKESGEKGTFNIPYWNSRKYILPIWILVIALVFYFNRNSFIKFFSFTEFHMPFKVALNIFKLKIPLVCFILIAIIITIMSSLRKWSLIPVISLLANLYLMTELGITNWMRFIIWLIIGLVVYLSFGMKNSRLNYSNK
jgi:amino acid transporter